MELTDDFLIEIVDEAYAGNVQSEFLVIVKLSGLKPRTMKEMSEHVTMIQISL